MKLIDRIKKNIQQDNYFDRGDTIIVGTSGGPDSTALTYILHKLQYEIGFHLHIAHFNHQIHRQANKDQEFVEHLARHLNVPCTTKNWKPSEKPIKGSLEDAARQQRFKFFRQLSKKINAKSVVLAHTKDDLAETILMRIIRGTGLQGLCGILPIREMNGICYIRPLLNIPKNDILAFLKKNRISFRTDPTNAQKEFFRNKVRLELIPLLTKNYNQNITDLLTNLANTMNIDFACLDEQARKLFLNLAKCPANRKSVRFDLKSFRKQHPSMQRMLVRISFEHLRGSKNRLTLSHIREIEDLFQNRPNGSIVHLPNAIQVKKSAVQFTLTHN